MAGTDDIQVNVTCDASDLTAGMTEVRDQLDQTIITIQRQEQSWMSFGSSVLGSVAKVAGPVITLITVQKQLAAGTIALGTASAIATPPTISFAAAVNFLLSPVVLTTAAIAALAATIYYFSGAASGGADSMKSVGDTAKETQSALTLIQSSMASVGSVAESFFAGLVGVSGLDAIDELSASFGELMTSLGELGSALLQPLKDAGFEIGSLAGLVTSFADTVKMMAETVKSAANGIRQLASMAKEGVQTLSILAVMAATGMNAEAAGRAVEARMKEREASIAAFRQRLAGPQMADQSPVTSSVASIIKANDQAIRELAIGHKEASISAAILAGATARETEMIREQLDEIESLTNAERERKQAEKEMLDNAQKQSALFQQSMNDIESLADQYDLLTGAADRYDIKRRELERQGRGREEIDAIIEAQKEVDKLQEAKNKTTKTSPLKAALQGSSESASILLRGLAPNTDPQVAEQKKTNGLLGNVVVAIKENKPQELQALTLNA